MINFSIVSYLEGEEFKKVRAIQKKLSEITGSKKSLEDWLPHITIGDGIAVSQVRLGEVESALENLAAAQKVVHAQIRGFAGIEDWKGSIPGKITPYVIWLNISVSPELKNLFSDLRDKLTANHETWLPRTINYIPHITLACADLSEEGYRAGMEYVSSLQFEETLTISHAALVECYGEGNMDSVEYHKFYFKG